MPCHQPRRGQVHRRRLGRRTLAYVGKLFVSLIKLKFFMTRMLAIMIDSISTSHSRGEE